MVDIKYTYRIWARVVLEAVTPLHVGTGGKSILTDSVVARDVNGLPYIPGTSLAGVLRHTLDLHTADRWFGSQKRGQEHGSEFLFTEARMVGADGRAVDGMKDVDWADAFYRHYRALPVRQHVCISHQGTARKSTKFDEEVVMKGTRFVFDVEQLSADGDDTVMRSVLGTLASRTFRLGAGTTNGFGRVQVVDSQLRIFDLSHPEDLQVYMDQASRLDSSLAGAEALCLSPTEQTDSVSYELHLRPEDVFLFGAGTGDEDADVRPVTESVVTWNAEGLPHIMERQTLVPATSIKGAVQHRAVYWYNKEHGVFADGKSREELESAATCLALQSLFGSISADGRSQTKGRVLFDDITSESPKCKVMNHVRIDRLTGGTVDGALFAEKVAEGNGLEFTLHMLLLPGADAEAVEAFEHALTDVCKGMLPLGGSVNRGYGTFRGVLMRDGKQLYPQKTEQR